MFVVTAMLAMFVSAYVIAGIELSSPAELIASYTLPICLVIWVQADAQRRHCTPCYDFGMFVLFAWALCVPAYLLWSRGWRGVLVVLVFFGLLISPSLAAMVFWLICNVEIVPVGA